MTKRSKPSRPPKHLSGQSRSITSWTIPEPADVLSYAYLWADEAERGQQEGLKDRPVVVVVARLVRDDRTELFVAPITHVQPPSGEGIEIPPRVKEHLGLDDDRSWIVATELNRFVWPGPDIRLTPDGDTPFYGVIPAKLFEQLRQVISDQATANRMRIPKRSE